MSGIIHDNEPCRWVTITNLNTATDAYPLDGKGAYTSTYSASEFGIKYKNAILMTIVITASAANEIANVHLPTGGTVMHFHSPSSGTHSFDVGGSAGVFMPQGFHIRIPASGGVTSVTAFFRPQ